MKTLIFSTGNSEKFLTAHQVCQQFGIALEQKDLAIDEIQEEDPQKVAIDKAQKAHEAAGQPVVITDDSWAFAGLNGFPGVYMHSINEWFTPDDFLRLTLPLKNRSVTLTQFLVFTDSGQPKVFSHQTHGTLLAEIRGTSLHPSHTVISLDGDNGLSIAETYAKATDKSTHHAAKIWHDFAAWLTK